MATPFLPGQTIKDLSKTQHHKAQTMKVVHGLAVHAGGKGLPSTEEIDAQLAELSAALPNLTYKTTNARVPATAPKVLPAHVVYDKKVLCFDAYFKQTIHESPLEHFRVRYVKIFYYLEDDTMSVVEPEVPNSGMPQGKLIKRQRLPKDELGNTWHWKDLNISIDCMFYGKVFHLTNCDGFTQDFLSRHGIEVSPPEAIPTDPFSQTRKAADKPITTYVTPSDYDKYKQFLSLDRKVLRFYCVWDDRGMMFGELRPFILHYYLVDDTVEVREVQETNSGRDPFPLLLRRQKVPRNHKNVPAVFPTIVLELKEEELTDCLDPSDFVVGQTVHIFGRPFLLYDCDEFTKEFYRRNFGLDDFAPVDVAPSAPAPPAREVPPHTRFGSHEDSLQSCTMLVPKPPKRDYLLKLLEFGNKTLRFAASLVSQKKEDAGRRFILSYHVANDTISIFEPPQRNSGIISGKFLEAQRVPKAGHDPSNPTYLGLDDLAIGARLAIHSHLFVLDDADDFVLGFMESHPDLFPPANVESVRARSKLAHTKVLQA